jgi:glycosyltransferase involved in cell wall biosynthesis
VPLVAGVRGNDIGRNIFHTERFAVTQWVVGGASRIVCVNAFLRERLLLAFPDAAVKTSVIPNSTAVPAVDAAGRSASRRATLAETGWSNDVVIVVFIGTLREKKGVATLLSAVDALSTDSPVRLLVIGPEIGSFEKQVCGDVWTRLLESGRCWSTGRLPLREVPGRAMGGDILTMPSTDDGLANALLEGMSLGLCPVATTVFGDVIRDGTNGLLVPPGDASALAQSLTELARDRHRICALGESARASMLLRTPADEASAYLELFATIRGLQPVLALVGR